jgi:uncharacterized protein (DUF885 family)
MNRREALGTLGAATLVGSGCASAPATTPAARLAALMHASDEALLERNPFRALSRGDLRHAARHGENLSDAYVDAERSAAEADLAALAAIDRRALAEADGVAYDAFRWRRDLALRQYQREPAALWTRLPLDHFNGWHIEFANLSSGRGVAPFRTLADYENGLSRIDGFVRWLDLAVARCREGIALGIVQPRFVVERMLAQFDQFIAQPLDASPWYGPVALWPAGLPDADRARIARAYAQAIERQMKPALARTREFLAGDYLRAARDSVAIGALPGGAAWYRHLVQEHTTTTLDVEVIHRLGIDETARLRAAMERVRSEVGFAGTLAQFFEFLRSDARFKPASAQALADGYRAIGERVDVALPRLFRRRPRAALELRPTPDYRAAGAAAGDYTAAAPDGSRPGVFYFNTHDLASRTTPTMESLYLHEAVPGHHHESALRREDTSLPAQQRFGWITAYGEGWALYAEGLGTELGLYTDPYQRFGWYEQDLWRALRLVVDTGLHALGWSRERAIDHLVAHSSRSRQQASSEVDRYIVWPGQALAYKIGALAVEARAQPRRSARAWTCAISTSRCSAADWCRLRCSKRRSNAGSRATAAGSVASCAVLPPRRRARCHRRVAKGS